MPRVPLILLLSTAAVILPLSACNTVWNPKEPASQQTDSPVVQPASAEEQARQQDAMRRAEAARSAGRMEEAIQDYQAAAAIPGGTAQAARELAELYEAKGDTAAALATLENARQTQLADEALDRHLAEIYLRQRQDDKALALAEQALKRQENQIAFYNIKGIVLDRRGEHGLALALYQGALNTPGITPPDREYTLNNMALSLVADGKAAEAVTLLEPELSRSSTQNPAALRQMLALAYGVSGNDDKAYELALADLSVPQVEENLHFYRAYREGRIDRAALFAPAGSR